MSLWPLSVVSHLIIGSPVKHPVALGYRNVGLFYRIYVDVSQLKPVGLRRENNCLSTGVGGGVCLEDHSQCSVVVVKPVKHGVVEVFAGQCQFCQSALFGRAEYYRRRSVRGFWMTDGDAMDRIVQTFLHALVPEFAAREGCRHKVHIQ